MRAAACSQRPLGIALASTASRRARLRLCVALCSKAERLVGRPATATGAREHAAPTTADHRLFLLTIPGPTRHRSRHRSRTYHARRSRHRSKTCHARRGRGSSAPKDGSPSDGRPRTGGSLFAPPKLAATVAAGAAVAAAVAAAATGGSYSTMAPAARSRQGFSRLAARDLSLSRWPLSALARVAPSLRRSGSCKTHRKTRCVATRCLVLTTNDRAAFPFKCSPFSEMCLMFYVVDDATLLPPPSAAWAAVKRAFAVECKGEVAEIDHRRLRSNTAAPPPPRVTVCRQTTFGSGGLRRRAARGARRGKGGGRGDRGLPHARASRRGWIAAP